MSNPITRSSFQSDMLPIVKKWFGDEYKNQDPLYKKIYEVVSSDQAFEVDALVAGMSTLQVKPEGEALKYDSAKQQYTPRYTHTTYGLGFKITMEMLEDATAFKNANRFTRMLAKAARESMNISAASVVNNGYVSGNTMDGGDGVILFSASHPTISGNQSNTISSNADLSEAALESLYVQIRKAKDSRGLQIDLKPRSLLVSPENEPDANRILYSEKRVLTSDNDLNFIRTNGMFPDGIVVSPYFTDTDQFTILTDCMDGLKWYQRKDPVIDNDNEFDSKNVCYSVVARWSQGWSDWRGAFASPGV